MSFSSQLARTNQENNHMVEKRKHKIMIKKKKIYDSPFPFNNAIVIVGLQEISIWLCIVWFNPKKGTELS
jgi:hypothetical protein